LTEPLKHSAPVPAAFFSPDGRCVLAVSHEPATRIWDAATGHLLFEPFQHGSPVKAALFFPDGNHVLTASDDDGLRFWAVPALPLPTPEWLPELAEAIATKRFDAQGRSVPVSAGRLIRLRQELASATGSDFYARWAKWFFA